MQKILMLLVLVIVLACNQNKSKTKKNSYERKKTNGPSLSYTCFFENQDKTDFVKWHDILEIVWEQDTPPYAVNIDHDLRRKKQYTCPIKKSDDAILHDLIPGKKCFGITNKNDSTQMNLWVSSKTKSDSVFYFNQWSGGYFPDSSMNNSIVDTSFIFKMGNKEYKLISFYTTQEFSPSYCGRYAGANVGIILLQKKANIYVLECFEVYLGSYGSFQNAPLPKYTIINKKLYVQYRFSNGGPGEPYTGYSEIFTLTNHELVLVDKEYFYSLHNTPYGGFTSTFIFKNENTLALESKGIIKPCVLKTEYAWIMENAPKIMVDTLTALQNDTSCYQFEYTKMKELKSNTFVTTKITHFTIKKYSE